MGGRWLGTRLMLCMLLAILALISTSANHSLPEPTPAPHQGRASRFGSHDIKQYQRTYTLHRCYGQVASRRACLFRNLYLHVPTKKLTYFEPKDAPQRVKLSGTRYTSSTFSAPESEVASDPFFLSNTFIQYGGEKKRIWYSDIHISHELPPPLILRNQSTPLRNHHHSSTTVRMMPGVTVFWMFDKHSSYSYGHCLVQDWFPMWLAMQPLFLHGAPQRFKIFTMSGYKQACAHYMESWSQASITEVGFLHNSTTQPWIHFDNAIFGHGGFWTESTRILQGPGIHNDVTMYSSENWRKFRDSVYRRYGIPVPHVNSCSKVLVIDKRREGRRAIMNVEHVMEHLRGVLGGSVEVQAVDFGDVSPEGQVHLMADTSVFITTQGSAGFRFVFLPDHARVIFIGTPPPKTNPLTAPFVRAMFPNEHRFDSFHELPQMFDLSHIQFLKYAIGGEYNDNATEWKRSGNAGVHKQYDPEWLAYNMNVELDVHRVERYVRQALWECNVETGLQW